MKIDESSINYNVVRLVKALVDGVYDYTDANDDMDHMRLATLGEIKGICMMAETMKEMLRA